MTGKPKWEVPYRSPNYSSTMVTGSNLVFTGVRMELVENTDFKDPELQVVALQRERQQR